MLMINYSINIAQSTKDSSFADYLFSQNEYYRAITEYRRDIFRSTDSVKNSKLLMQIGLCYYNGEDYNEYISFYENNQPKFIFNTQLDTESHLLYAKSLYHKKNYRGAIYSLDIGFQDKPFDYDKELVIGLSYARLFKWDDAIAHFNYIKNQNIRPQTVNELLICMNHSSNYSSKSSLTAGILSAVIPGAGYIYCDRIGTGLSAFVVNALLIWALRDAIVNKQYGLSAAIAFFGSGWYIGNIAGSSEAANEYNNKVLNDGIDKTLREVGLKEFLNIK